MALIEELVFAPERGAHPLAPARIDALVGVEPGAEHFVKGLADELLGGEPEAGKVGLIGEAANPLTVPIGDHGRNVVGDLPQPLFTGLCFRCLSLQRCVEYRGDQRNGEQRDRDRCNDQVRQVVAQGDGRSERHHAHEMHRPDADTQRNRAADQPVPHLAGAGCGNARCE